MVIQHLKPQDWSQFATEHHAAYAYLVRMDNAREAEHLATMRRLERECGQRFVRLNGWQRRRLAELLRYLKWRISAGWATEDERAIYPL